MARLAAIEKNNRRKSTSTKFWKLRRELRAKSLNPALSDQERDAAFLKLQRLPRDTSPARVINRCELTGRPRGNYQKFGLSRMAFRQLALDGKLPGVTKSSW